MAEARLYQFVHESNCIEGITRRPTNDEIIAHEKFLDLPEVRLPELENFVKEVAGRPLRKRYGMDVVVGAHRPPPGGPQIPTDLINLLGQIADGDLTHYEAHVAYEQLHPFMDGNGRSGRVLWAWQMQRDGLDPISLPFLHRFYYQALDASRVTALARALDTGEGES